MSTQRATGPLHQAYYETATESDDDSSASDDDGSEEEDDDDFDQRRSTPANVGTKRSDPAIVNKKNKYATSDSGYSSLTATTASSSQSKKAPEQPSAKEKIKQKLVQTLRGPTKTVAPTQRPSTPRRMSQRHDRKLGHELRSVESREEAARMSLTGASVRATAGRRPSEPATRAMPGGYPPSPTLAPAVPRPIPRQRASTTQTSGQRPVSYHAGSAPMVYQVQPGQPTLAASSSGQHFVITNPTPRLVQQTQQQPPQQYYYASQVQPQQSQPLTINTAGYYQGSYTQPPGYMSTPTSSSPYAAGYGYPHAMGNQQGYPQAQSQYPPQLPMQPHSQWGTPSGGYTGGASDFWEPQDRRMSMNNPSIPSYNHYGQTQYYQDPPQAHLHQIRRMSQTVQNPGPMFRPPPRTPVDEGVFFDDDDPADYYRDFRHVIDREMMPPPPPVRPQSSQRARPPLQIHSRTTSAVHRLSRGSIEYTPEQPPHRTSIEAIRPPSRPGLPSRFSTSSAHQRQLVQAQTQAEPLSPVRSRRRHGSIYGPEGLSTVEAAEAYQRERTGGYGPSVDDIPLARHATKSSDTGSRGSRGSGGREGTEKAAKRAHRQSLDKSKLREQHDAGVSLSIGTVKMNLKEGTSMTIKQSNEGMKSSAAAAAAAQPVAGGSRPGSTKPTRESSRARGERPEVTRYMSANVSTRSGNKERGEVEVARKRRSSSVQPRVGRDDGVKELDDQLRRFRLEHGSRPSRTNSRSGRADR